MRIQVKRTGGFAGRTKRAEVDTSCRPDAAVWHTLAREAIAPGPGVPTGSVPDGFTYEITVDGRTVRRSEPHLTRAQRELVTRVLREGS